MRVLAQIFAIIAILISIAWLAYNPGFDSAAAVAASATALASTYFLKKDEKSPKQVQSVATNSTGIQAGRDVKFNKIDK